MSEFNINSHTYLRTEYFPEKYTPEYGKRKQRIICFFRSPNPNRTRPVSVSATHIKSLNGVDQRILNDITQKEKLRSSDSHKIYPTDTESFMHDCMDAVQECHGEKGIPNGNMYIPCQYGTIFLNKNDKGLYDNANFCDKDGKGFDKKSINPPVNSLEEASKKIYGSYRRHKSRLGDVI